MQAQRRRAYNRRMFTSQFDYLRRKKALEEGRDISLRMVALESGVSLSTLQRIKKDELLKLNLATVDALCRYFNVSSVGELIEYVRDPANEEF